MTHIGHKARADAIAEQIKRRHGTTHTREVVRAETRAELPAQIVDELLRMAQTIDELKAKADELDQIKADHARLAGHFRTVGQLILGDKT